jgi:MOSC domain-containing protein YiiM
VPVVVAVHASRDHRFSKESRDRIELHEGLGVVGDAHYGTTVQHRSRVRVDPSQPNLRQVHLIHAALFDLLAGHGHVVAPGDLGENVTTRGIDLLGLPVGTRLTLGTVVLTVTGLRNPCVQIDTFRAGLLKEVVHTDEHGEVVRLAGVMAIVSRGGVVRPGAEIHVELPAGPRLPLTRV